MFLLLFASWKHGAEQEHRQFLDLPGPTSGGAASWGQGQVAAVFLPAISEEGKGVPTHSGTLSLPEFC